MVCMGGLVYYGKLRGCGLIGVAVINFCAELFKV